MNDMYATNRGSVSARLLGAVLTSLIALGGCASGPKNYEIKAVADPVINRDVSGRPLSVVVHIYQLKDPGEFSKLTSDTLASGRPLSELLGKDLLEVNEVMLVPGSTENRSDKIQPDARHVGIVAFFRQPDQHYWRVLVDAFDDTVIVNEKMADSINDYLHTAIRVGGEIPAAMKPILQSMIDQGLLVDENGDKIRDLESIGVTFSETMTQGFDRVVKKLDELISRLGGVASGFGAIPRNIDTTITTRHVNVHENITLPTGGSPPSRWSWWSSTRSRPSPCPTGASNTGG